MYNKVFLIGRLTKDPEKRFTPAGIPVTRFAIAVNRITGRDREPEVDFINITAWRKLAEICGEYLKKGRLVAIEGALRLSNFTGRDGAKKTFSEVVAENMQMLERKPETSGIQEPLVKNQEDETNFNPENFEA